MSIIVRLFRVVHDRPDCSYFLLLLTFSKFFNVCPSSSIAAIHCKVTFAQFAFEFTINYRKERNGPDRADAIARARPRDRTVSSGYTISLRQWLTLRSNNHRSTKFKETCQGRKEWTCKLISVKSLSISIVPCKPVKAGPLVWYWRALFDGISCGWEYEYKEADEDGTGSSQGERESPNPVAGTEGR